MSQYGAYGAARSGLNWRQILAFYYPGTQQVHQRPGTTIRVWITADHDSDLKVLPAPGLQVGDSSGHSYVLPTGQDYRAWRVSRSGRGFALAHRTASGSWARQPVTLDTGTWEFSDRAQLVTLSLPGGTHRVLRGRVGLVKRGSGGRTVNRLGMDDYVRGVVASEMPTSWLPDAVRAQAVAARSYAARLQAGARTAGYDICDTSSCQVYRGYAAETRNGNAAVSATARTILRYGRAIALTQFASSNGGASARGGYPYLVAQPDPYDGIVASNRWTRTISAASVASSWPAAGSVQRLRITARDGSGPWGGRVTSITIVGARRNVHVTGSAFASRFGLRSRLFSFGGVSAGKTPRPRALPPVLPGYGTFPRTYSPRARAELLVVTAKGRLLAYPTGVAGLGRPATLATVFARYTHVFNAGDYNGDGFQDVIARPRKGR